MISCKSSQFKVQWCYKYKHFLNSSAMRKSMKDKHRGNRTICSDNLPVYKTFVHMSYVDICDVQKR